MVSGINFYLWSWLTYTYCIEKYKESPAALCNSACKISGWLPITKANDKLLYVGKKITPHNGPRLTNWSLTHWRVPSWPVSPSFFEVGLVARGSNCTVRLRRLPYKHAPIQKNVIFPRSSLSDHGTRYTAVLTYRTATCAILCVRSILSQQCMNNSEKAIRSYIVNSEPPVRKHERNWDIRAVGREEPPFG